MQEFQRTCVASYIAVLYVHAWWLINHDAQKASIASMYTYAYSYVAATYGIAYVRSYGRRQKK